MNKANDRQRGVVAIVVVGSLAALLAITALAVDVGHIFVVRNQTQNAVDAAALRGAVFLYAPGSNTPDFSAGGPAVTNATNTVPLNISVTGNDSLVVVANYWQTLNPSAASNEAAVKVTLTKQVKLYFAPIFGMQTSNVTASAIAVVQAPTVMGPGGITLPMTIGSCMFNQYWNSNTNQPLNNPVTNQPYVFQIGSSYAYSGGNSATSCTGSNCCSGQWSPLSNTQDNSDSTIQSLIASGNPATLSAGDQVWLQTGNQNNLYDLVNNCSESGNHSCEYATVPVISNITPGTSQSITAMACMHIISAIGGNGKYITAQMSTGCAPINAGGSGSSYGVVSAPKLAQ